MALIVGGVRNVPSLRSTDCGMSPLVMSSDSLSHCTDIDSPWRESGSEISVVPAV